MSKPTNNSSAPSHKTHSTIIGNLISLCLQIILLALVAWFCLLLWFDAMSFVKGSDTAYAALNQLALYQQAVFKYVTDGSQLLINFSPANVVQRLFIQTHALDMLNILAEKISLRNYSVNIAGNLYPACLPAAFLLMVTEVILSRLFLFILSLPLLLWCLLPSVIDGLVQRDIRKFQAMRESTFFFHRAKQLLPIVFYVPLFGFFVCPLAFNALWVLLPMALMVSIITLFSLQQFKKYL